MKIIQSAALRAICAIIVGILMLIYPIEAQRWTSVAVGILFIVPGIASVISFYVHKNDEAPENHRPMFPIAGWGSILLGALILILNSQTEQTVFILLGMLLIILAISSFINLIMNRRYHKTSAVIYVIHIIICAVGIAALLYNKETFGIIPLRIFQGIAGAFLLYGLTEIYSVVCISVGKRKYEKRLREEELAKAQTEIEVAEEKEIQEAIGETAESTIGENTDNAVGQSENQSNENTTTNKWTQTSFNE